MGFASSGAAPGVGGLLLFVDRRMDWRHWDVMVVVVAISTKVAVLLMCTHLLAGVV